METAPNTRVIASRFRFENPSRGRVGMRKRKSARSTCDLLNVVNDGVIRSQNHRQINVLLRKIKKTVLDYTMIETSCSWFKFQEIKKRKSIMYLELLFFPLRDNKTKIVWYDPFGFAFHAV